MVFFQAVGAFPYEGESHLGFFASEEEARECLKKANSGEFDSFYIYECKLGDGSEGRSLITSFWLQGNGELTET